jgi:hypothetical protein
MATLPAIIASKSAVRLLVALAPPVEMETFAAPEGRPPPGSAIKFSDGVAAG